MFWNVKNLSKKRIKRTLRNLPDHDNAIRRFYEGVDLIANEQPKSSTDSVINNLADISQFASVFQDLDVHATKVIKDEEIDWSEGTINYLIGLNLTKQFFALILFDKRPSINGLRYFSTILKSGEQAIQSAAISILYKHQFNYAKDDVAVIYNSTHSPFLRQLAGDYLGIGQNETVSRKSDYNRLHLESLIKSDCSDTRLSAIQDLIQKDESWSRELLRIAAFDKNHDVQMAALKHLLSIDDFSEKEIIELLDNNRAPVRAKAIKKLAVDKKYNTAPLIAQELLKDAGHESRKAAAKAILELGDEQILPTIFEAMNREGEYCDVRLPLVKFVARFKTDICLKMLEQYLNISRESVYPNQDTNKIWIAAIRAISDFPQANVNKILANALNHTCSDVRKVVANLMRSKSIQINSQALEQRLNIEEDKNVRNAIESTLLAFENKTNAVVENDLDRDVSQLLLSRAMEQTLSNEDFDELIRLLQNTDVNIRRRTAKALSSSVHRPLFVEHLFDSLPDLSGRQLVTTLDTLGMLQAIEAIDRIVPFLLSDTVNARRAAEKTLRKLGYDKNKLTYEILVSTVERALKNKNHRTLGKLKEQSIPILRKILTDFEKDPEKSYSACQLLCKGINWRPETELEQVICFSHSEQNGDLSYTLSRRHLPYVIKYITYAQVHSGSLLTEVSRLDDDDGKNLVSLFPYVTEYSNWFKLPKLTAGFAPRTNLLVRNCLRSKNPIEVINAARTIRITKDPDAEELLINALEIWLTGDVDKLIATKLRTSVDDELALALGALKAHKAIPVLSRLINERQQNSESAITALMEIGGSEAVFVLRSVLNSDLLLNQMAAAKALSELSWMPTSAREMALIALETGNAAQFKEALSMDSEIILDLMVKHPERTYPTSIRSIVYEINNPCVFFILSKHISSTDVSLSRSAEIALRRFGESAVHTLLTQYFTNGKIDTTRSTYCLANLPSVFEPLKSTSTVDFLCAFLDTPGDHHNASSISAAAIGLGRKKDTAAVPSLVRALRFRHPQARRAVLKSLVQLKAVDAIDDIKQAPSTSDNTEKMEALAYEAVSKLESRRN